MLLAHYGRIATEAELIRATAMEEGGVDIEELARVARRWGLRAEVQELSLDALVQLVAQERFPLVYLNRFPLDAQFAIHAVIPVRFTRHYVTLLDPRVGERRVSRRKFEAGRRYLSFYGVVCEPI
jgi:ABC-type bacteriocin/lantibiotic exporter with double-glycine peptidase domain